ncbi:MAG: hypothetical protein M3Y59_25585 [Myxococcota bacterium]|nr:hypothetical protein [Myxococcota bacterium]
METHPPQGPGDWKRQESLRSVLTQVVVVGSLLALAVFFAYRRGVDKQEATAAIEQARQLIRLDAPSDLRAALQILEPALQSRVRGGDAHALAARVLAELGVVHADADAQRQAAVHLAAAAKEDSEVEERFSAQALLAVGAGRAADGVTQMMALTQTGMRRLDLEYVLARAQLATGRTDLALATLARAAQIASGEPRIHALHADLLAEVGDLGEAVASYRRALAGNAQHPSARLGLALAQARRSGDPAVIDAAVAALQREGSFSPALAARVEASRTAAASALAVDVP